MSTWTVCACGAVVDSSEAHAAFHEIYPFPPPQPEPEPEATP